jgi:hypothetical protein
MEGGSKVDQARRVRGEAKFQLFFRGLEKKVCRIFSKPLWERRKGRTFARAFGKPLTQLKEKYREYAELSH